MIGVALYIGYILGVENDIPLNYCWFPCDGPQIADCGMFPLLLKLNASELPSSSSSGIASEFLPVSSESPFYVSLSQTDEGGSAISV